MSAFTCPRCRARNTFADGQQKVCRECNYPGPKVQMTSKSGTAGDAPPSAATSHAAAPAWPGRAPPDAPAKAARAAEPAAATETMREPAAPARPDALGRLRHRVARTFLLGPEPIVDILDHGLSTRGVFTGKQGWVLTPERLHGLSTGRRHQRFVLDRARVSSIGIAHRPRPVGVFAAAVSFAVALVALAGIEAAAWLAPSLLVYPVLVMVFGAGVGAAVGHAFGRHLVVEVVADGQALAIPMPGISDDAVMEFAARAMGTARVRLPAGPMPGQPATKTAPGPKVAPAPKTAPAGKATPEKETPPRPPAPKQPTRTART